MNGQLKTIMMAMGNEFDEVLKKQTKHPQVFYKNGYSWENDVWNKNVLKGVIQELSAVQIENNDIDVNLNDFIDKMKVAVNADGYLFKRNSSYFPGKTGYMFCVECAPVDLPHIKESDLNSKLVIKGLKKRNVNAFGKRYSIDTLKHCYGHLLADYCCQLIAHYLRKRHSLTTISNNILYRIAINKFFQLCFENGQVYEYYENQFKKNEA